MTATSRFVNERPIVCDRAESLVALIGFREQIRAIGRGLFERCQLRALELPNPTRACRMLEMIAPDAVVLDSHHPDFKFRSQAALRLLQVAATYKRSGRNTAFVVLNSAGFSSELKNVFLDAGAVLLPVRLQTYRYLARLVRHQCGFSGDCCATAPAHFNHPLIVTLHQRH